MPLWHSNERNRLFVDQKGVFQPPHPRLLNWKVWLVAADCLLLGMQPVLIHLSKSASKQYAYHPLSVNVLTEAAKTGFAAALLLILGVGRRGKAKPRSLAFFVQECRRQSSLLLPAGLYTINSYLKFMMLLFFKPTTAKMLGNLKVLVIAVLMRIILRRKFTVLQWEALILLCVGVTINQLDYCSKENAAVPWSAVFCTAASLLVPSSASIFNEWALKREVETPLQLQNFFLYLFGLLLNALGMVIVSVRDARPVTSLFAGQNKYTALLILSSAIQGVLSSVFYKYADTVLKKYSSTLATIITALLSAAIFDHSVTLNFVLAVITISCSMHIYFNRGSSTFEGSPEQAGKPRFSRGWQYDISSQADIENPESLLVSKTKA